MINNKLNFNEFCNLYFNRAIDLSVENNMKIAIAFFNNYLSSEMSYKQWRLLLNTRG